MFPLLVVSPGPESDRHDTGSAHPECHDRLVAVEHGIRAAGFDEAKAWLRGRPATEEELLRVHEATYLESVRDFVSAGGGDLDPDTHVSPGSWDTALVAAGSGLSAVQALDRGEAAAAFVAVRPPGHHATSDRAMGFCLINNVAVTAASLASRGERVVIVDWDVHHGNGTQDVFWDDPRVMYVSTHQWPLYPGTGKPGDTGGPSAPGLTINVPLPAGATGDVARRALEQLAAPAVEVFSPTWVLVSAGFDAHRDDPLAGLAWSAGDYADLVTTVASWAPAPGRLIAVLEGGYDLTALARSVAATTSAMAGAPLHPEEATSGGPGLDVVEALVERRRRLGPHL